MLERRNEIDKGRLGLCQMISRAKMVSTRDDCFAPSSRDQILMSQDGKHAEHVRTRCMIYGVDRCAYGLIDQVEFPKIGVMTIKDPGFNESKNDSHHY